MITVAIFGLSIKISGDKTVVERQRKIQNIEAALGMNKVKFDTGIERPRGWGGGVGGY